MKGRTAPWRSTLILCCVALLAGCVEWLEVDSGTERSDTVEAVSLPDSLSGAPSLKPTWNDPGPLLPRTAGLRVPAGHWLRARVSGRDVVIPFTWLAVEPGPTSLDLEGSSSLIIRLQAHGGESSVLSVPWVRAVLQVLVPAGSTPSDIMGLALGAEALSGSVLSLKLQSNNTVRVKVTTVTLHRHGEHAIRGTIEGHVATRKGDDLSPVKLAFIAHDGNAAVPSRPRVPEQD